MNTIDYDAFCIRCGACCGSEDGDPCLNLVKDANGGYHCKVYVNRLGAQKTISGKSFDCVPISENLKKGVRYHNCGYLLRGGNSRQNT
ncbi:MAG: hypothetical protein AUJ75_04770 [Candidatus Omnitrophica bacterium CG1_02_49_10]|nr:MAG: hypothetical protein AUJ75_04770 [Candidatus Omnitrophica bacterium CG1_02_49_10]